MYQLRGKFIGVFVGVFLLLASSSFAIQFEAAEMSLSEFARWYSDYSEKTVIVGKDVTGFINFKARDITKENIDSFFASVVVASGYTLEKTNGVVVITSKPAFDLIDNSPPVLGAVVSVEEKPLEIPVNFEYSFEFVDVVSVLPALGQSLGVPLVRGPGNNIVFTGSALQVERLSFLCGALDRPARSIHVEAIIAELNGDDVKELSASLFTDLVSDGVQAGSKIAETFQLLNPPVGAFVSVIEGGRFAGLIRALETSDKSKLLSTPSLLVADRSTGRVVVGQEVPFITGKSTGAVSGTDNPFQTITRADVGLVLSVTPSIISDDLVRLVIAQSSDSVALISGAADIVTNKRSFSTTVEVKPGTVIFMGGLLVQDSHDSVKRIPFLSSIPYLGRLFTGTKKQLTTRNLTVILKITLV